MVRARSVVLPRLAAGVLATLVLGFASPWPLWAQAKLENPQPGSFQSGIGVISGWVCRAGRVDIVFDNAATFQACYGTSREDTRSVCGDANNGFGLLFNWNLLGNGVHTVRALADGVEFGRATFTVTTLGTEFLTGASGTYTLLDFPRVGTNTIVRWEESLQNFVIVSVVVPPGGGSEFVVLLSPPDSACEDLTVTFQWRIENQRAGVIYCSDVITDKGVNPFDGGFEDIFHAGQATTLQKSLDPIRYDPATFEWGVRVTACDSPNASCLPQTPPCAGRSFESNIRILRTSSKAPSCP